MTNRKTIALIFLFLGVILTLFILDYTNEKGLSGSKFFGNVMKAISSRTITADVLAGTSLKDASITSLKRDDHLFVPYLALPESITASRYQINGTSILISEVSASLTGRQAENPSHIIDELLRQRSPDYEFNTINPFTFYLNQIPMETKTHNFLTIMIHNRIYGFQYKPLEHRKVLEIIDALGKDQ